jgi:hypothetical protein
MTCARLQVVIYVERLTVVLLCSVPCLLVEISRLIEIHRYARHSAKFEF